MPAAACRHPSRHRRRGDRPHASSRRARCGATRGRAARPRGRAGGRRGQGAAGAPAGLRRRGAGAHGRSGARGVATRLTRASARSTWRGCDRAEPGAAGRRHPRRRRRLRRALGRACSTTPSRPGGLRPRPRLRLDRLRPARRHGRVARQRPTVPVVGADRRRRLQHGDRRAGDARAASSRRVTIIVVNNAASGYVKALQHLMYGRAATSRATSSR